MEGMLEVQPLSLSVLISGVIRKFQDATCKAVNIMVIYIIDKDVRIVTVIKWHVTKRERSGW